MINTNDSTLKTELRKADSNLILGKYDLVIRSCYKIGRLLAELEGEDELPKISSFITELDNEDPSEDDQSDKRRQLWIKFARLLILSNLTVDNPCLNEETLRGFWALAFWLESEFKKDEKYANYLKVSKVEYAIQRIGNSKAINELLNDVYCLLTFLTIENFIVDEPSFEEMEAEVNSARTTISVFESSLQRYLREIIHFFSAVSAFLSGMSAGAGIFLLLAALPALVAPSFIILIPAFAFLIFSGVSACLNLRLFSQKITEFALHLPSTLKSFSKLSTAKKVTALFFGLASSCSGILAGVFTYSTLMHFLTFGFGAALISNPFILAAVGVGCLLLGLSVALLLWSTSLDFIKDFSFSKEKLYAWISSLTASKALNYLFVALFPAISLIWLGYNSFLSANALSTFIGNAASIVTSVISFLGQTLLTIQTASLVVSSIKKGFSSLFSHLINKPNSPSPNQRLSHQANKTATQKIKTLCSTLARLIDGSWDALQTAASGSGVICWVLSVFEGIRGTTATLSETNENNEINKEVKTNGETERSVIHTIGLFGLRNYSENKPYSKGNRLIPGSGWSEAPVMQP
ncbi:Dot/Icm T4SS effector CoxCC3 [Coxiella burnetii]|uniref:Dot/Icm T4SS effector CoxCC3 n=1 Tax=Coxiella burnetii TaxID=777 RepID=UPI00223254F3|nr:Dot/Icm T4SS effector CoxCC3 [Coxiella burnetii]